jgi:glyoxylase-like metal-dependent hydrolase (beta-lactamase superfamily II)
MSHVPTVNPTMAAMESPLPALFASTPEPLPFAPSLDIRAFVLERAAGNVLIHSVPELAAHSDAIGELGGIARRYMGHGHEAMFASASFGAPLFVHERDSAEVERASHVRGTFSRRHVLDDDFEVIPIPGHTPGSTAYLWDSGEHRMLFTADSIYLADGEWVAAVLASSDRAAYVESLELIRELDFDVLVPWAASGRPYHAMTTASESRRRIDVILARLRGGEDH